MAASDKLKWKRLINELRYVHTEMDCVKGISEEASRDFGEYCEEVCERYNIDMESIHQQHADEQRREQEAAEAAAEGEDPSMTEIALKEDDIRVDAEEESEEIVETEYEMTQDEREIHESFKVVFKKLALLLHPDKLEAGDFTEEEKSEMTEEFQAARSSYEKRRYFILVDLAERYRVKTPKNYRQQTRWMKKELKELKHELSQEKQTYNYVFSESETDEQRDFLVKQYLTRAYGIDFIEKEVATEEI